MKTQSQPLSSDLPEDLRTHLAAVPAVTADNLEELRDAAKQLDNDPAFQAEYLKSLFVEKLLAALGERNENQNQLALRWGKSRQYVSKLFNEDKRVNFTIETMAELAHLLGRRLEIQVLSPGESCHVVHSQTIVRQANKKCRPPLHKSMASKPALEQVH
jgi:transcriptional regulator with XRE-family HTH domain